MKRIAAIIVTMFVATSVFAQIGVVGGVTSSSADIESAVADVNNLTQYHVGVAFKLPLGKLITIQPEVLYNVKGAELSTLSLANVENQIDMSTGFVEVPVQVQVGAKVAGVLRVYGFGEGFAGYAVTNQVKYSNVEDVYKDWDNIKSRLEYGVSAGAGIEFMDNYQLSVKYFWNIGDFYDANLDAISEAVKGSCSGIAATLAIFF